MARFFKLNDDTITMKYKRIQSIEELLSDESFLAWHFRTDENNVMEWNEILSTEEFYRKLADEAVSFLNEIRLKEHTSSDEAIKKAEEKLMRSITHNQR
jgi:transmembrane sensor